MWRIASFSVRSRGRTSTTLLLPLSVSSSCDSKATTSPSMTTTAVEESYVPPSATLPHTNTRPAPLHMSQVTSSKMNGPIIIPSPPHRRHSTPPAHVRARVSQTNRTHSSDACTLTNPRIARPDHNRVRVQLHVRPARRADHVWRDGPSLRGRDQSERALVVGRDGRGRVLERDAEGGGVGFAVLCPALCPRDEAR